MLIGEHSQRPSHPPSLTNPINNSRIRLQTGMRGAWGKPYGTVARVDIGQIILSIRSRESNRAVVIEALRRARYKFPGRQKIIVSKKWGFTNVNKEDYLKLKEEKLVIQCVSLRAYCICSQQLNYPQGRCLRPVHPSTRQPRGKSPTSTPRMMTYHRAVVFDRFVLLYCLSVCLCH